MSINRRRFIQKSLMGIAGASLLPLSSCSSTERITILHTNDVHSHIDPFPDGHKRWPGLGGATRRMTLVNQIRQEQEHVLLLDAGDMFQGTPYFNLYQGKLEIELMNRMGYDAVTLGNHEFDNGLDALAENMDKANFPIVCSNYEFQKTVLECATNPHLITERGNVRIGIVGLGIGLEGLVNPELCKGVKCNEPVEIANQTASFLKKEKQCDLVIALSHLGYRYKTEQISDVKLAEQSENIDLIIGGHTHTFMERPVLIKNKGGKQVIIHQVGWAGVYLGRLDLELKRNAGEMVLLNSIYHV